MRINSANFAEYIEGRDPGDENDAKIWHCVECQWTGPTDKLSQKSWVAPRLPVCGGCGKYVVATIET